MAVTIRGSGQVPVQIQTVTKTDAFTAQSGSMIDITGLSVSITPTNASNKILVFLTMQILGLSGTNSVVWQLVRGSTAIAIGGANSNRSRVSGLALYSSDANSQQSVSTSFLDSPATTSSVTYKVQAASADNNNNYILVNRSSNYTDNSTFYNSTTVSTLTVMEIAYA